MDLEQLEKVGVEFLKHLQQYATMKFKKLEKMPVPESGKWGTAQITFNYKLYNGESEIDFSKHKNYFRDIMKRFSIGNNKKVCFYRLPIPKEYKGCNVELNNIAVRVVSACEIQITDFFRVGCELEHLPPDIEHIRFDLNYRLSV